MLKFSGLVFMILLNAICLNRIIIINKIIKTPSYLSSFVFVICSLPLIHLLNYWAFTISTLLFILIYNEIVQFNDTMERPGGVFKTGFFLGLIILIDYNTVFLYPSILFALLHYRQFNRKNFLIQLIGVLYPLMFYYILGVFDYINSNLLYTQAHSFETMYSYFKMYPTFLLIILTILLLSLYELYNNYYKKNEKSKRGFKMLLVIALTILTHALFAKSLKLLGFLIMPITITITNYLLYTKHKKFRTFLLGLLIVSFVFEIFYL